MPGELTILELGTDPRARALDQVAGIDAAWLLGGAACGVAARAMRDTGWRTFTVTVTTEAGNTSELGKLERLAAHPKLLGPAYHLVTFHDDRRVLEAAVVDTEQLTTAARNAADAGRIRTGRSGDRFTWISFDELTLDSHYTAPALEVLAS
jgi:hypothetical protein